MLTSIETYIISLMPSSLKEGINKILSSNIGRRIASGAFWTILSSVFTKILFLATTFFVVRILGKEKYGELGIIRSTISMFVIFASLGIGITASKYIAQYKHSDIEKAGIVGSISLLFSFILGLIISLLVFFFAFEISNRTLEAPYLTTCIQLSSILLFLSTITGAQNGILVGYEDFKAIAKNNLFFGIAEILFISIGAFFYGVLGALIGFSISFFILAIANFLSIKSNNIKYKISFKYKNLKFKDFDIIIKFSLPAALSSFLVTPILWYIRTLLVKIDGFGELSVFDISEQWRMLILYFPSALSQIVLPLLSSHNIEDSISKESFSRILYINCFINGGISLFIALFVIIFSRYIMSFYGAEFSQTTSLVLLALSTIFSSLNIVVGQAIASIGKMWIGFVFNMIWGVIVVLCSIYLLDFGYKSTALAFAIFIAYIISFIIQFVYLKMLFITNRDQNEKK